MQSIESWIKTLPMSVIETTPWLLFWLGSCRMPFNPAESLPHFERAFSAFEREGDQVGILLAWCGAVQSIWFAWKDLAQLDRWIDRLSAVQPPERAYPSPQIEAQVTSSMIHALMIRRPDPAWLASWVERALAMVHRADNLNERLFLGNVVIQYLIVWKGQFDVAGQVLSILSEGLRAGNPSPFALSVFHLGRATYLWQTGRVQEALDDIEAGLSICDSQGVFLYLSSFLGYGVHIATAAGKSERAEKLFDRFERLIEGSEGVLMKGFYYSLAAWWALMQGRVRDAWRHAQAGLKCADDHEGLFAMIQQAIGAAQVCHEMGKTPEARALIVRAHDSAKMLRDFYCHWPLGLIESLIEWEAGDQIKALQCLRKAMQFGCAKRMSDTGWWRPDMMAKLCALALEHDIEPDYVRWLIAGRALTPPVNGMATDAWPWPIKIRTLGTFMIERDGKPIEFGRKTPKKPLELLKAIITLGGEAVPETILADHLWPDAEGDVAHEAFAKTLQRLRHLLGHEEALPLRDGKVSLNRQVCWVDALAFDALATEALAGTANGSLAAGGRALSFYRGSFLGIDEAGWATDRRTALRAKYGRLVEHLFHQWRLRGESLRGTECIRQAMTVEPGLESLWRLLPAPAPGFVHQTFGSTEQ